MQTAILRIGKVRFGIADAAAEESMRSIADPERLDRVVDAMLTAKSWQDLRATE